jgi:hypothetical protein
MSLLLFVPMSFAVHPVTDSDGDGIPDDRDPRPYLADIPQIECIVDPLIYGIAYDDNGTVKQTNTAKVSRSFSDTRKHTERLYEEFKIVSTAHESQGLSLGFMSGKDASIGFNLGASSARDTSRTVLDSSDYSRDLESQRTQSDSSELTALTERSYTKSSGYFRTGIRFLNHGQRPARVKNIVLKVMELRPGDTQPSIFQNLTLEDRNLISLPGPQEAPQSTNTTPPKKAEFTVPANTSEQTAPGQAVWIPKESTSEVRDLVGRRSLVWVQPTYDVELESPGESYAALTAAVLQKCFLLTLLDETGRLSFSYISAMPEGRLTLAAALRRAGFGPLEVTRHGQGDYLTRFRGVANTLPVGYTVDPDGTDSADPVRGLWTVLPTVGSSGDRRLSETILPGSVVQIAFLRLPALERLPEYERRFCLSNGLPVAAGVYRKLHLEDVGALKARGLLTADDAVVRGAWIGDVRTGDRIALTLEGFQVNGETEEVPFSPSDINPQQTWYWRYLNARIVAGKRVAIASIHDVADLGLSLCFRSPCKSSELVPLEDLVPAVQPWLRQHAGGRIVVSFLIPQWLGGDDVTKLYLITAVTKASLRVGRAITLPYVPPGTVSILGPPDPVRIWAAELPLHDEEFYKYSEFSVDVEIVGTRVRRRYASTMICKDSVPQRPR